MGLEEQISDIISELQLGRGSSLFGSLTVLRTSVIKSSEGRAKLLQSGVVKLLLDLLKDKTRHGGQTKMSDLVLSILANLCVDHSTSLQILKCGGLEAIATFTTSSEQESIHNRGVRALSNLAQIEAVMDELFNLEVPEFVATRLLETDDAECRVTYCRALRQIGKTSGAVRRLVEDTRAVQALTKMLKLDDKKLALKSLRILSEFSAIRCCTQFTAQVLAAKAEVELVTYSDDGDSDVAYFSLSLIYRLCDQGLVRPSLGAAGVVALLVRLMSSTRPHVNRVSVLNALCLCSKDSVNRDRLRDAGALEVFVSALKGKEEAACFQEECLKLNQDGDNFGTFKSSKFSVLYERIISSLVNFIYHDDCMKKLLDLGLVDTLLQHLQRCCTLQSSSDTNIISEIKSLADEMEIGQRDSAQIHENEEMISLAEKMGSSLDKDSKCEEHYDGECNISVASSAMESGGTAHCSHNPHSTNANKSSEGSTFEAETERIRHESTGLTNLVDFSVDKESDSIAASACATVDYVLHEEAGKADDNEEEEEEVSRHILSRDPLNIDNQNFNHTRDVQLSDSVTANECNSDSHEMPSQRLRHVFSINSPTYQSELSRKVEDYSSGVTCKNFSHSHSHPHPLLKTQESTASNMSKSPLQMSPSSFPSPCFNSPAGYRSPYSPLSADASYYSPAQSSPTYSGAACSPPSSQPPQSPASSSQPFQSPALSVLSSSLVSPARSSLSSPSPLHIPSYHSPPAGNFPESFSPLSETHFITSPLQPAEEADAQTLGLDSQRTASLVDSQSPLISLSDRQIDCVDDDLGTVSGHVQNQTLSSFSLETATSTQNSLTITSPLYSSTDDENEETYVRICGDKDCTSEGKGESSESKTVYDAGKNFMTNDIDAVDREVNTPGTSKFDRVENRETNAPKEDKNWYEVQNAKEISDSSSVSLSGKAKCSKKRSSSTDPDSVHNLPGENPWPKRSKVEMNSSENNPSYATPSQINLEQPEILVTDLSSSPAMSQVDSEAFTPEAVGDTEDLGAAQAGPSHHDSVGGNLSKEVKRVTPRSSKVYRKFQHMIVAPEPENLIPSQKGFKKRISHSWAKTPDLESPAAQESLRTDPSNEVHTSPETSLSLQSSQPVQDAVLTQRISASPGARYQSAETKLSVKVTATSRTDKSKGPSGDQKLNRIMRTTESNILILLSAISVKPGLQACLAEANVTSCLLTYIRAGPAPLQRSCRTLTRLLSNPLLFPKLLLCQVPALIVRLLILDEDGTFPAAMFCAEWENQLGQVRRSRMNLSDLLPSTQSSDDIGTAGSQASDFGHKLDFEFGGDAYSKAKSQSSSIHNTHRLFKYLYHECRSLSVDSQCARDGGLSSHSGEEVYTPGACRVEARVRVGLSLLRCLGALAVSSYGEGEIQHVLQRGTSSDVLGLRISLLHMPIAWGRMTRHQFALKYRSTWDTILPHLFTVQAPQAVREIILVALSFNLHVDFPPKLVVRVLTMMPCSDAIHIKAHGFGSSAAAHSKRINSVAQQMNQSICDPNTSGNAKCPKASRHSALHSVASEHVNMQNMQLQRYTVTKVEKPEIQSPKLFDDDDVDEEGLTPHGGLDHRKCPYWTNIASLDVFFIIRENDIVYRHGAVRDIIMRKSEVFAAMLGGAYAERLKVEIELTDTKAASFECLMHYLHGCTCSNCSVLCCLTVNKLFTRSCDRTSPGATEKMASLELGAVKLREHASATSSEAAQATYYSHTKSHNILDTSEAAASCSTSKCDIDPSPTLSLNKVDCENAVGSALLPNPTDEVQGDDPICRGDSDPHIQSQNEELKILEELINKCSEVLALADRYLLTELVSYITSVLSHICLHPHTWEELFALACFYKLRPLAVDCMREALLAHVPVEDTAASLLDLGVMGYKDQAIEALSLLLKSARIH